MARFTLAILIGALVMVLEPSSAAAHAGEDHLSTAVLLRTWTWDPLVLATLALAGGIYARGVRALWRKAGQGRGIRKSEALCYTAGLLAIFVALISPLDGLSDALFSAHMTQHEALMLVAAPLIVLGRPFLPALWALPPAPRARVVAFLERPRVRSAWRRVSGPFAALVIHGAVVWLWHIPQLFEAALASEAVHAVQHAMFFMTAALFWWAMLQGRYGRAGYGVAVAYVFATAMHTGFLGVILTAADRIYYPTHAARTREWGLDALEDQRLAGLLMWIPMGVLFALIALALFAAWLGEAERRVGRSRYEGISGRAIDAIDEEAAEALPAKSAGGVGSEGGV